MRPLWQATCDCNYAIDVALETCLMKLIARRGCARIRHRDLSPQEEALSSSTNRGTSFLYLHS